MQSLVTSPEISCGTIRDDIKEEINKEFDLILEKVSSLQSQAFELVQRPQYHEFEFVDKFFIDILGSFDRVHQVMGWAISQYLGSKMMQMIMKDTKSDPKPKDAELKYENEIMPPSIYTSIFTFSSLLGELKKAIEKYENGKPQMTVNTSVSLSELQ